MIEITLKHTLDDEFVSDILITAFDGGVGACWYWCEPDRTDGSFLGTQESESLDTQWTECRIAVEDETGPEDAVVRHTVNAEVIRLGIQRLLDRSDIVAPYIRDYVLSAVAEQDAGHVDAEAADAIVQAGLFDTLVYG